MGPNPVIVQDIPVAILRFSLKYVFKARELAEVVMPIPEPGIKIRVSKFVRSGHSNGVGLTIKDCEGEEVGDERVGNGCKEQRTHDQECATETHLAVGKAPEEGSICQSDAVSKCRVHVDYRRNLTRGDAQQGKSFPEQESELLQYWECCKLWEEGNEVVIETGRSRAVGDGNGQNRNQ